MAKKLLVLKILCEEDNMSDIENHLEEVLYNSQNGQSQLKRSLVEDFAFSEQDPVMNPDPDFTL